MTTNFGTYLRSLRETQGYSRPQLRDKIRDRFGDSFSTSSLENWENGKGYPPANDLARIVVVLDADYEEVFSRLVAETRPGSAQVGHAARDSQAPRGVSRGAGGGARHRRSKNGSTGQ